MFFLVLVFVLVSGCVGGQVGCSVCQSIGGWVHVLGLMNKCIGGWLVGRWEGGKMGRWVGEWENG